MTPFTSEAGARANFEVFIRRMHEQLDDQLTEYGEEFVTRNHPELGQVMHRVLEADNNGGNIDALEESPEYELYYAELAGVIQAVLQRLVKDYSTNIFGRQAWREQQRKRAMVGAP